MGASTVLREVAATGAAAWPSIAFPADRFAELLAARVDPDDASDLHAADLFLACACASRLPEALAAFERAVWPQVAPAIQRLARTPQASEEVAQLTRQKLFVGPEPKIAEYSGHGTLVNWVRAVAIRTAIDLRRSEERSEVIEDRLFELAEPDGAGPESLYIKARHREDFRKAFEEAVASLPVEDRNLLRLHFLDRLTLEELGRLRGVNKSTLSRQLDRCRRQLMKRTRRNLSERLRLGPEELDSLLRYIESQLDIRLSAVLPPPGPQST